MRALLQEMSSTSKSDRTDLASWTKCVVCEQQLNSKFDFIRHLRTFHCKKEGGSFVCLYGPNNVCPSLPVDGVSVTDYDAHVHRNHVMSESRLSSQSEDTVEDDRQKWRPYISQVNLPAVLNDPRWTRKQSDFFTKTWGSAFDKSDVSPCLSIPTVTRDDFKKYLRRVKRHRLQKSIPPIASESEHQNALLEKLTSAVGKSKVELEQIPKLFFSPNFTLEDLDTFKAVFPWTDVRSSKQDNVTERQSAKLLQEKLGHYLDVIEIQIAKQISMRSDVFFHAMTSHDKLQEDMRHTSAAIVKLRDKIHGIDKTLSGGPLKILKLSKTRNNHVQVYNKLKLMATVHQTQPTIQLLLSTCEFVGALDLIATTQEVLQQELQGIVCFRHLGSQLTELSKLIDKMIQEDFAKYANEDLNRPVTEEATLMNHFDPTLIRLQETLVSIVLGCLRLQKFNFIDVYKEETCLTLKATLKQTVIEAVSKAEDNDLSAISLADQMRQLSYSQWMKLLLKVFANLLVILSRAKAMCDAIQQVLDLASDRPCLTEHQQSVSGTVTMNGYSDQTEDGQAEPGLGREEEDEEINNKNEIGSGQEDETPTPQGSQQEDQTPGPQGSQTSAETNHTISVSGEVDIMLTHPQYVRESHRVHDLLCELCDFAHSRCEKLLVSRAKDGFLDRLSSAEFVSVSRGIEQFVRNCEGLCGRKSTALRACLQTQGTKFINRFHEDRRTKLALILDNERWKRDDVPVEFQALVNHVIENGELRLPEKKPGAASAQEFLLVEGEKFAVVGTVLMLLKMSIEYCQILEDIPAAAPDILSRLVEILKTFNSRTCQLILGAGALQLVGLKTITTKNLALASRCLQLVILFLPRMKKHFEEHLPPSRLGMLKYFEQVLKDYQDHVAELDNKLVAIMDSMIEQSLSKWEVKPPMPSNCFRNMCRQVLKLHEAVIELLPDSQMITLFSRIHQMFIVHLRLQLIKHGVTNDGGPQHGLVMADVAFYVDSLQKVPGMTDIDSNMPDIWDKS